MQKSILFRWAWHRCASKMLLFSNSLVSEQTLNWILWSWSCWTSLRGKCTALGGAPNAVPPPPPIILPLDLSLCHPYLFSLSFLYFCPNTHLFSLFPPGKFVLDVRSMPAKNSHNTSSIIKPNIYVVTSLTPLPFYLLLPAADCRLNLRHAGVLLVERRGSYPLIDLRILKSKTPF